MSARNRTASTSTFYSGRDLAAEGLLDAAQEAALAVAARAGDPAARDRLVRANVRLVVAIAKDFRGRGLEPEDLVGEGNLGLMRAAVEFDPRYGVRFSTYASHWIKQAIRHALLTTAAPIRLPAHMVGLLTKWRRAERAYLRAHGTSPTAEQLAATLGLGAAKRRMVEQALLAVRLLPGGSAEERSAAEEELAAAAADPGAGLESAEAGAELARRLGRLDARERSIVALRYGLGGGEALTLKEVGRRLGMTREWVRKLEVRAVAKLGDGWRASSSVSGRRRRRVVPA